MAIPMIQTERCMSETVISDPSKSNMRVFSEKLMSETIETLMSEPREMLMNELSETYSS